jgi:hypothetical protein
MGQEIVYCSVCGDRILESHFKKGKAVTLLKKNYCPKCAQNVVKESPKKEAASPSTAEPPSPRKLETRRIPMADKPYRPGGKLPIPMPFIVAIAIGVIAIFLLIVVLRRGGQ